MSLLLTADPHGLRLDFALAIRDATVDTDAAWALAAARCAGLADAHWDEPTLRSALRHGLRVLSDHPDAAIDARIESAHCDVLDGLSADTHSDLLDRLDTAADRFVAAAAAEEGRPDALLMASCLRGLLAFARGAPHATVAAFGAEAEGCLRERALYGIPAAIEPASRRVQEAAWAQLVDSLVEAQRVRTTTWWGDSAAAAKSLVEAIRASRTVRAAPAAGPRACAVVTPAITAGLVDRLEHRRLLAAAIEQATLPDDLAADATALLESAETELAQPLLSDAVTNALGADLAHRLRDRLEETEMAELDRAVASASTPAPSRDAQWQEAYARALDSIGDAPDLTGPHGPTIRRIIANLIDFVAQRLTFSLASHGGALAYLGKSNALEREMADDLAVFLRFYCGHEVDVEVPNEGDGGRVDVRVRVGEDRFVIECKRLPKVNDDALQGPLAQTGRYLHVSLRIAALAVLDLSDKSTGHSRGLDSSVDAHRLPAVDGTTIDRYAICIVIPGNRGSTPSVVGRDSARKI